MADVAEQLRTWRRRIWRRRRLCLTVTWALCAPGWTALGLVPAAQSAGGAGLCLSLVLLVGAAAGALAAAVVAGRDPVFDSVAELQESFDQPVLGSVASMSTGLWARANLDLRFTIACAGLIAMFAGLLALQALGLAAR